MMVARAADDEDDNDTDGVTCMCMLMRLWIVLHDDDV